MTHTYSTKKSPQGDWHREDIKAAIIKTGTNFSKLSIELGYKNRRQLNHALDRPWPQGEKHICKRLRDFGEYPNIQPEHIWPSRYFNKPNSTPKKCALHGKNKEVN